METFGRALRRAREAASLSQQELADRAGLTASGVGQLEREARTRPYPHTVRALADALDLAPDERARLFATLTASSDPPVTRATLPASPDLIGREDDLRGLIARIVQERLVTVTGAGGVGKTALTVAAANAVADRFPGGAKYVALADVDEISPALDTIGRSLGVVDGGDEMLGRLRTAVGDVPTLLVLDNLEQLPEMGRQIAQLVTAVPQLTILATSRARLRTANEHVFPLTPLALTSPTTVGSASDTGSAAAPSDAARLLEHRARSHGTAVAGADTSLLETICRRLDGLPLAIELIAPWLRVLTPGEIIDRLDDTLPLLIDGPSDRPARHRTMRATIAWSEALLDEEPRELFHRLAVLPADWDLATAAVVVDRPDDEVLRGVGLLTERNLVHRTADGRDGRARFRMLETVRAYARERLRDDETEAAFARLARVTTVFCDDAAEGLAGPDQAGWLVQVDRRLPDLRASLRWETQHGDPGRAARCYVALMWAWYLRHTTEADAWGRRLLETTLSEEDRGRVEATFALVVFARGDLVASGRLAAQAAHRGRGADDADGILRALTVSVNVAAALGQPTDLETAAAELRRIADGEGSRFAPVARAVASLAELRVACAIGDHERTAALLTTTDREVEQARTPWLRVLWLNVAVEREHLRGRHDGTRALLQRSISACLDLEDAPGLGYALASLAVDLALEGRPIDASRVLGAADGHRDRTGHRLTDPNVLAMLTDLRVRLETDLGPGAVADAIQDGRDLAPRAALQLAGSA